MSAGLAIPPVFPEGAYDRTPEATVRRHPERATYDRASIHAILDEALYCDVAFVTDGRPFVLPCIHARVGDELFLHGAVASRLMSVVSSGGELCITATLVDGLVLARSWFAHSMNYRSAVVFGRGREVIEVVDKARALRAIVEHVMPGRSRDARPPTPKELAATTVVAVTLEHGSAKVRRGLPKDQRRRLRAAGVGGGAAAAGGGAATRPGSPDGGQAARPGLRPPLPSSRRRPCGVGGRRPIGGRDPACRCRLRAPARTG